MSTDKQHPPTPARIAKLRREGQVPQSAALRRAVAAAAGAGAAMVLLPGTGEALAQLLLMVATGEPAAAWWPVVRRCGIAAVSIAGLAGLSALLAGLVQTRGLVHGGALSSLRSWRPGSAFVQHFRTDAIVSGLINAAAVATQLLWLLAVLGGAVSLSLVVMQHGLVGDALAARDALTPSPIAAPLAGLVIRLTAGLVAIQLVAGALDLLWQRHRFIARHRMALHELRDEHRDQEGDPEQRHALERQRQELLRMPPLVRVDGATVLVRNPTHIAVALLYDEELHEAPIVLMAGRGDLARRMVARATRRDIPQLEDRPLARALVNVEIGDPIPTELYGVVAEVIRWVAELQRSRDDASREPPPPHSEDWR